MAKFSIVEELGVLEFLYIVQKFVQLYCKIFSQFLKVILSYVLEIFMLWFFFKRNKRIYLYMVIYLKELGVGNGLNVYYCVWVSMVFCIQIVERYFRNKGINVYMVFGV